jgi:AraC-like DNA-binding protein
MRALCEEFTHEAYTPQTQIVFPVQGLHYIGTDRREVLLDLNHVAFVPRDITTKDRHPSLGDVSCIVLTPSPELLEEAWHAAGACPPQLRGSACVIQPTAPADQIRSGILAARAQLDGSDNSAVEEILLKMLRRTAGITFDRSVHVARRSLLLARRVADLLATTSEWLSLSQIAQAVGASPAYLTDLFHRIEGMPIYRYQTRLRLASALRALSHAEDLSQLALDFGFSSHSHFSSVFRSTFGMTPSRYRDSTRRPIVSVDLG